MLTPLAQPLIGEEALKLQLVKLGRNSGRPWTVFKVRVRNTFKQVKKTGKDYYYLTYALNSAGSRLKLYQLRQARDNNSNVIRHHDDCAVYKVYRQLPSSHLEQVTKKNQEIFLIPNYIPIDVEGYNGTGANFVNEYLSLFAEFDLGSIDEQWHKLKQFNASTGLNPSLVLFSGGKSLHIYLSLSKPTTDKARWQTLQQKLIVCLGSDPSIKTLNREMRAAGFYRQGKGQYQSVQYFSDNAYSIDEIEAALNSTGKFPFGLSEGRFSRWKNEGDSVLSIPEDKLYPKLKPIKVSSSASSFTGEIPLEELLSRASREALNGVHSNRNATGFALAKDLIGCADWLSANGYRYRGDPYLIFIDYCQNCAPGGGWNQREWDSVWKSAQRGTPKPSREESSLISSTHFWQRENDLEYRASLKKQRSETASDSYQKHLEWENEYLALFGSLDGFDEYYQQLVKAEIIQLIGRQRAHLYPDEHFKLYLVGTNQDLSFLSVYFGIQVNQKEAFEICPEAGTKTQAGRWAILKAFSEAIATGKKLAKISTTEVSQAIGLTQGRISQLVKVLGGWREFKKLLAPLCNSYREINSFSTQIEDNWLRVIFDLPPLEAIKEAVEIVKAVGADELHNIASFETRVRLVGILLSLLPHQVLKELETLVELPGTPEKALAM